MLVPNLVRFNYYPGSIVGEYPERYEERILGIGGVIEIREHPAGGDGDRWFYDVVYENGSMERIFNPHQVFYQSKQ